MKNYFRAVRLVFKYKFTIITSIVCAVIIGLLWGMNIGTVYPFVEISFNGETVADWIVRRTDELESQKQLIDLEQKRRLGEKTPPFERPDMEEKFAKLALKSDLQLENDHLIADQSQAWYRWITPSVQKYAPKDPFMTVVYLVLFVFFGTFIKAIFIYLHGIMVTRISNLAAYHVREMLYGKLLDYEVNYFNREGVTDAMSRMTGDVTTMTTGIGLLFGKMVREPVKLMTCLIGAAIVSWQLLILTILIAPIAGFLIHWLAKSIRRVVRKSLQQMSVMFGRLEESFRSIRIIKSFTRERFERSKFRRTNRKLYDIGMKIAKYDSLASPLTELLGMIMVFVGILAGAYLVMYEQTHLFGIPMCRSPMTLGSLLLFFALLAGAADPARRLSDFFTSFQSAVAAADRIYGLIDREIPLAEKTNADRLFRHVDSIVFENVCFEYEPERPILKNISFEIKFGETIAIIGSSGCGKSTLLSLLLRFIDPQSGNIKIDGIPVESVRLRDLRGQMGLVTQEPILFNETVYNNIRYGKSTASDEEIILAAKQANAHDFIEKDLSEGYATMVGPGGGLLSGGQRQRIAIARGMVRDPAIFLLDEATSQIDLNSERIIHEALAEYVGSRTTIMVTHRLSVLPLADRIMVMQEGEILGFGTHEELMKTCDFYAKLRHSEILE